jgi:hypothetical protein
MTAAPYYPLPPSGALSAPSSKSRLLARYGAGLDLRLEDPEAVVARTEGVSASFIKELPCRAVLLAA